MKCCCLWTLYLSHMSSISTQIISMNISVQRGFWFTQSEGKTLPGTRFKGRQELWSRFLDGFSRLMHQMCDHIGDSEPNPNDDICFSIRHQGSRQNWSNHYKSEKRRRNDRIVLRNKSGRTSAVWRQKLLLQLVGQRQTGGEQVIIDFVITVIIIY